MRGIRRGGRSTGIKAREEANSGSGWQWRGSELVEQDAPGVTEEIFGGNSAAIFRERREGQRVQNTNLQTALSSENRSADVISTVATPQRVHSVQRRSESTLACSGGGLKVVRPLEDRGADRCRVPVMVGAPAGGGCEELPAVRESSPDLF